MTSPEYDWRFYVGPLGAMRQLPDAAKEVDTPLSVIGGTHVSLSGAFTRDRYGFKRSWTWAYPLLTAHQAQWVEALQRGMVAGPLYLIDPRRPNRLPEQAASGGSLLRTPSGFIPSNTATCAWRAMPSISTADLSTLPAAPLLRGALEWQLVVAGAARLELAGYAPDGRLDIPVRGEETLEASTWCLGPPEATVTMTLTAYSAGGAELAAETTSSVLIPSLTTWQPMALTMDTPAGTAYARLSFDTDSATPAGSIYLTALQVAPPEPGPIPGFSVLCDDPDPTGGWRLGGGAPQVVPDGGAAAYVLPGLQSMALTLYER